MHLQATPGCLRSSWRGRGLVSSALTGAVVASLVLPPFAIAQTTGPDLAVTQEATVLEFMPGETVTYNFTYVNKGPVDATGVFLVETVPTNSTTGANPGWEWIPRARACCVTESPQVSRAFFRSGL